MNSPKQWTISRRGAGNFDGDSGERGTCSGAKCAVYRRLSWVTAVVGLPASVRV